MVKWWVVRMAAILAFVLEAVVISTHGNAMTASQSDDNPALQKIDALKGSKLGYLPIQERFDPSKELKLEVGPDHGPIIQRKVPAGFAQNDVLDAFKQNSFGRGRAEFQTYALAESHQLINIISEVRKLPAQHEDKLNDIGVPSLAPAEAKPDPGKAHLRPPLRIALLAIALVILVGIGICIWFFVWIVPEVMSDGW